MHLVQLVPICEYGIAISTISAMKSKLSEEEEARKRKEDEMKKKLEEQQAAGAARFTRTDISDGIRNYFNVLNAGRTRS